MSNQLKTKRKKQNLISNKSTGNKNQKKLFNDENKNLSNRLKILCEDFNKKRVQNKQQTFIRNNVDDEFSK